MKKQIFITIKRAGSKLTSIGLTFLLFCCSATALAQGSCWTSVGSDGTVDEADLGVVALSPNTAAVRSATLGATVEIRYNVVATDGIFGGESKTKNLTVRFADNGNSAQVIVRLITFNIISGVSSTLVEFNSNNFPPSNVAQAKTVGFNCQKPEFDFEKNIYFIEVQLIKTGINGNPLIRGIIICGNGIC